jgi:hypothetical protein
MPSRLSFAESFDTALRKAEGYALAHMQKTEGWQGVIDHCNAHNQTGQTLLGWALHRAPFVVAFLLDEGADVNQSSFARQQWRMPLDILLEESGKSAVNRLLPELLKRGATTPDATRTLHQALVRWDSLEIRSPSVPARLFSDLVARGVNLEAQNRDGDTMVLAAVRYHSLFLSDLLALEVDLGAKNGEEDVWVLAERLPVKIQKTVLALLQEAWPGHEQRQLQRGLCLSAEAAILPARRL